MTTLAFSWTAHYGDRFAQGKGMPTADFTLEDLPSKNRPSTLPQRYPDFDVPLGPSPWLVHHEITPVFNRRLPELQRHFRAKGYELTAALNPDLTSDPDYASPRIHVWLTPLKQSHKAHLG